MTLPRALWEWANDIHNVPSEDTDGACGFCLGASGAGYQSCYRCAMHWMIQAPDIGDTCDLIVPCTVAVPPSRWYTAMFHYKRQAGWRRYAGVVAQVLHAWLGSHWSEVVGALDGAPTVVSVVPSASAPMPTPLAHVVMAQPLLKQVSTQAVSYVGESHDWKRRRLSPESFATDSHVVSGKTVLLVEDTWVTGSTALSAAVAVRRAGAAKLALLSIARMANTDYMTDAYLEAARPPFNPALYPR